MMDQRIELPRSEGNCDGYPGGPSKFSVVARRTDKMILNAKSTYAETYRHLFDVSPPESVTIGESNADIISPARGFMTPFDFTMQLQVGCPGGCLFCYVPAGGRLTPSAVKGPQGRTWGYEVRNKIDVSKKLRKHVEKGTLADKTVYWSGITDPYAAPPNVTQDLWQTLLDTPQPLRPRRIAVQTRFRPDRDLDLLTEYRRNTSPSDAGPPVVMSFSVGTDRNDLIRAWEKATPSYDQRMASINTLCEAGIYVVATLSPFGFWNDLQGTLRQLKSFGVSYITVLFMKEKTRSANTPSLFLAYLRNEFPQLLDPVWQQKQLSEIQEVFGHERVMVGQDGFASLISPHLVNR